MKTADPNPELRNFPSEVVELLRSQIHPAPYNPRKITPDGRKRLKRSIKKYGVVGGIVVNTQTGNTIVGGHQKVAVLDEMNRYDADTGDNDYPLRVELINVDPTTEKELNLTLNNSNVGGEWDIDALAAIMPDVSYKDAGFSEEDLHVIGVDYLLQTEAENHMANELDGLHNAALDATRAQRAAQGAGQPQTNNAPSQQQTGGAEPATATSGVTEGVDSFYDESADGDGDSNTDDEHQDPEGEPSPEDLEAQRQAKIAHNKEVKRKVMEQATAAAADMEAYVVLSFDTWQAKADFVQRFGFGPNEKFIKGEVFDQRCERVFDDGNELEENDE